MADDIDLCRTEVGASIMRTALEAIQELHKPMPMVPGLEETPVCDGCENPGRFVYWPCPTRRLADQGLGDNLARTTKNGDNNE